MCHGDCSGYADTEWCVYRDWQDHSCCTMMCVCVRVCHVHTRMIVYVLMYVDVMIHISYISIYIHMYIQYILIYIYIYHTYKQYICIYIYIIHHTSKDCYYLGTFLFLMFCFHFHGERP